MGIFDFLSRNKQQANQSDPAKDLNSTSVIPEEIFIEKTEGSGRAFENGATGPQQETVQANVFYNIGELYRFLDRNLESKGYDDALLNPDSYHLEQNLNALKMELMRTIKRVRTFYEDFIREINYHVESRSRSGMVDTVEELRMKQEIADSHLAKVLLIEDDALNNKGDSQGQIVSYTKGFKNGLAAISHHSIISKKL